ncbi:efflux RND transporter periplasmic adaptor subunit [Paraglaciecola sp. 25GB23A]|uniref:efflux RND transporter periplasmic adaptor subunit n=1 Tax=Paraglaciecola sp. 25GB23A TaxID=3156068 RepID=UPI0032AE8833
MNDKSELLQQLKIDRNSPPESTGIKIWQLILAVIVCVALAIWLTLEFLVPSNSVTASSGVVASTSVNQNPANVEQANQPAKVLENKSILNSSGYITARRMATVSSEVMGLITEVNVEEGMNVEQGQILARLDDAIAQVNFDYAVAQIAVLEARRKSTIANLDEAKSAYQRVLKNTYSSDAERTRAFATQQSLLANLESADADLLLAKIEVRRQQERLDDHTIRAPFSGVVTQKNAQPGEIVAPSSAGGGFTRTGICTIVDMSSLEIEVDVNEAFIGRVYPGQKVEATLDAYPDWLIPASVIATIPTADRAKATVQVRIKIESSDPRILPDMGVKVGFLKE